MSETRHAVIALFGPLTAGERRTIRQLREFDNDYGFVGTTPTEGATVQQAATFVLDDNEEDPLSWLESRLRGWHLPFVAFQAAPPPG